MGCKRSRCKAQSGLYDLMAVEGTQQEVRCSNVLFSCILHESAVKDRTENDKCVLVSKDCHLVLQQLN